MSELQALIFDVDGTLAETERDAHLPAFNQAFSERGLDWHWSEELYGELLSVTGGKERMRYYLERYRANEPLPPEVDNLIAQLHAEKTRCYTDLVAAGRTPLRVGVRRLLEEARAAGIRLAIATTTSLPNVEALLQHSLSLDALSWFEVFGAGDIVKAKKPAPDIYTYVLDQLQLPPQACLAIEDSANGVRSARAAGLEVLVTVSEYTRHDDFSGAALVVDSLGEPNQASRVLSGQLAGNYVDVAALQQLAKSL
jgi:HAD superfamily hydrolase (TIGR01509 family)